MGTHYELQAKYYNATEGVTRWACISKHKTRLAALRSYIKQDFSGYTEIRLLEITPEYLPKRRKYLARPKEEQR